MRRLVKNIKVGESELEIAIAGRDKMEREIAKTYPDAEYHGYLGLVSIRIEY